MTLEDQIARLDAENRALRARLRDAVAAPRSRAARREADRLARLEGAYDTLKVVRPMTIAVLGLFLAALVFALALVGTQIRHVSQKVEAIPARLSEEFRAMRIEMAAQTEAIANSMTATRQAPPQVLVMPAPAQAPSR